MAIRIIADSSADLTTQEAEALHVHIVSMSIQFGDRSYLDGVDLSKPEFYQLLAAGKDSPTTAQPTPADFLTPLEEAKEAGDEAVVIPLSSQLSGTYQSAVIAKDMCEYSPIQVVDSRSASAGIHLLVEEACRLRDSGASVQEILWNIFAGVAVSPTSRPVWAQ